MLCGQRGGEGRTLDTELCLVLTLTLHLLLGEPSQQKVLAQSWPGIGIVEPLGFPNSSVGKVSACHAGDPRSIPGSGRSAGEGIGYPLQYSSAALVPQLVTNPPTMRETWVRSLGWEDPLEKGKITHSSILAWRIPWTVQSMGSQRVGHD